MPKATTPTATTLKGQPAAVGRVAAVYRCRLQLDQLTATDDPDIKYCEHCQQRVFKVSDVDGFEQAVAAKRCVWGKTGRSASDRVGRERHFLGEGAGLFYEVQPTSPTWDD